MKAIMGTVRNGQIVVDEPVEWPEGFRVVIKPAMEEEMSEVIAPIVVLMDQVEPVEITPVEETAREADHKAEKEWEKTNFDRRIR